MSNAYFITAIGTPLTEDEKLHQPGLEVQLADQWNAGIDGILVAGTMGAMQLLTDDTYRLLVERSVALSAGKGEVLIGAGDAGFARSRDKIKFVNNFKIDGIAVLAPFFWKFGQPELVEYFASLADVAKSPLYLYDLLAVTGTKLSMETVLKLAQHPNIAGIKISGQMQFARRLRDNVGDSFRIITAEPEMIDVLIHHGMGNHLDGMWAMCPAWTVSIGKYAAQGDWAKAAESQRKVAQLKENTVLKYGFGAFTNVMNARGIEGYFAPRPFTRLDGQRLDSLMNEDIVKKLLAEDPANLG